MTARCVSDERCGCPSGFHRFGARCLMLLDQPETNSHDAEFKCRNRDSFVDVLYATLAVPRSKAENDQMKLAAVQLQTSSLTKTWLGVYQLDNGSGLGNDNCWVTQFFWASGQVGSLFNPVSYSPPGVTVGKGGWYLESWNVEAPGYKPLCQLAFCYRPDCARPNRP